MNWLLRILKSHCFILLSSFNFEKFSNALTIVSETKSSASKLFLHKLNAKRFKAPTSARARIILQKKLWIHAKELGIKKSKSVHVKAEYTCTCGEEENKSSTVIVK